MPPGHSDNIEVGGNGGMVVHCFAVPWVWCVLGLEALSENTVYFSNTGRQCILSLPIFTITWDRGPFMATTVCLLMA